jgi:hypothetical protein
VLPGGGIRQLSRERALRRTGICGLNIEMELGEIGEDE